MSVFLSLLAGVGAVSSLVKTISDSVYQAKARGYETQLEAIDKEMFKSNINSQIDALGLTKKDYEQKFSAFEGATDLLRGSSFARLYGGDLTGQSGDAAHAEDANAKMAFRSLVNMYDVSNSQQAGMGHEFTEGSTSQINADTAKSDFGAYVKQVTGAAEVYGQGIASIDAAIATYSDILTGLDTSGSGTGSGTGSGSVGDGDPEDRPGHGGHNPPPEDETQGTPKDLDAEDLGKTGLPVNDNQDDDKAGSGGHRNGEDFTKNENGQNVPEADPNADTSKTNSPKSKARGDLDKAGLGENGGPAVKKDDTDLSKDNGDMNKSSSPKSNGSGKRKPTGDDGEPAPSNGNDNKGGEPAEKTAPSNKGGDMSDMDVAEAVEKAFKPAKVTKKNRGDMDIR